MATVIDQDWFLAFLEELNKKKEEPEVKEEVVNPTSSKWKLVERKFDDEEVEVAEKSIEEKTE